MNKLFLPLILTLLATIAQSKTPDLANMSEEEKQATGLHKLTADELNALSQWMRHEQLTINREIRERNAGFEARRQEMERRDIRARLVNTYDDKLGNTYFELDNGQLWKRISGGSVFIKKDGRKLVTIEPKMMGSWLLKVDGNRGVKVKRIK